MLCAGSSCSLCLMGLESLNKCLPNRRGSLSLYLSLSRFVFNTLSVSPTHSITSLSPPLIPNQRGSLQVPGGLNMNECSCLLWVRGPKLPLNIHIHTHMHVEESVWKHGRPCMCPCHSYVCLTRADKAVPSIYATQRCWCSEDTPTGIEQPWDRIKPKIFFCYYCSTSTNQQEQGLITGLQTGIS